MMKTKHTLIIFAFGLLLTFFGALFKITHIEIGPLNGNNSLAIGTFVEILGVILFIYKLLTRKNNKDFLNS